ncbi:MAG: helix-turn-helix transcriptional regulator [Bacteroidota bacterium]
MRVALFLTTYLSARRLTQKEMAERLAVSREYYARLESGKGKPSVKVLNKISSLLGVNVEAIFSSRNGEAIDPVLQEISENILLMKNYEKIQVLNAVRTIRRGG